MYIYIHIHTHTYIYVYIIYERNVKSFSNETLGFFSSESSVSLFLLHFGSCQNCMSSTNLVAEIH